MLLGKLPQYADAGLLVGLDHQHLLMAHRCPPPIVGRRRGECLLSPVRQCTRGIAQQSRCRRLVLRIGRERLAAQLMSPIVFALLLVHANIVGVAARPRQ